MQYSSLAQYMCNTLAPNLLHHSLSAETPLGQPNPSRVSPRRRVTKFKRVPGQIQLLQRMEVYPQLQTPDGAT
eukprot:5191261-Pyramimonas_sp.AAC.1